ncbi:MAG: hypothetical protein ACRDQX_10225 [Pseudonocardiaceae bacterium]
MTGEENAVLERLLDRMTEDWTLLRAVRKTVLDTQARLRTRIAQALELGATGRGISRRTQIPEANVRRWATSPDTTNDHGVDQGYAPTRTPGDGRQSTDRSELVRTLGPDDAAAS